MPLLITNGQQELCLAGTFREIRFSGVPHIFKMEGVAHSPIEEDAYDITDNVRDVGLEYSSYIIREIRLRKGWRVK